MNFDEPKPLNDVAEFHETFDLPVLDEPQLIPEDRAQLRINLLTEELKELKEAIANDDLVEIADALCDLQYVLSGAVLEFGMGKNFRALFDEVHRSNMSKTCATREEAKDTIEHYAQTKGEEGEWIEKNGKYIVYRKSDQKVLKSVRYSEADLKSRLTQ